MELIKLIETVKTLVPEAVDTRVKNVSDAGVYLYLESVNRVSGNSDDVLLSIIVAGESFINTINLVEKIRERFLLAESNFTGKNPFLCITNKSDQLYRFEVVLAVELYTKKRHCDVNLEEI